MSAETVATQEPRTPRRQFIIEVVAQYRVPPAWSILRVLGTEDRPTGAGTNTERVYICLAEEVPDE